MKIKINQIVPDPEQPRKTFSPDRTSDLKSSLNSLGLIQPITVRPYLDGKYMIIIGERRFTAAKQRGDAEIECNIRETVDDKTAREMQFVENIQQENVPPMELGKALFDYRQKYNISQRQLSNIIGLSDMQIRRYEALHTDLQPEVALYVKNGQLDGRTAYEISTIHEPKLQQQFAETVVRNDLSRDTTAKAQYSIVKANDSGEWNINNNKLFFSLIEYGFQVGVDQTITIIKTNIPSAYIDIFNNGLCISNNN